MTDALKAAPVLIAVMGPPLLAALRGWPLLGWLWVVGFTFLAVVTTVEEPPGYDMHHLGLHVFGSAAVAATFAIGLGGVLRRIRSDRQARREAM